MSLRSFKQENGPDHVYYNLNYANTTNDYIPVQFKDYRGEGILDLSKGKYNCTVSRFLIPGTSIPLFYWKNSNGSAVDTDYSITFGKPATLRPRTYLQYTPYNNRNKFYIYSIQHFLDILNDALYRGYTDFNAAFPGLVTTAPYMIFDSSTQLFSFVAEENYAINNVNIFFNSSLYLFFDNIEAYFYGTNRVDGDDYQLFIKNNGNNKLSAIPLPPLGPQLTPVGYKMTQEFSNTYLFMSFRSIIITSSLLPLRSEYFPVTSLSSSSGSEFSETSLSILTDFEPPFESTKDVRSYLHYQPSLYRWIDLIGDNVIRQCDINVFWVDNKQVMHRLDLGPGEYFSIKILFSRKDINNYSN